MARAPRTRIGVGLYRQGRRLVLKVKACGVQRERWLPLSTSKGQIADERAKLLQAIRRASTIPSRGTLAADVDRYLAQIQQLVSWKERRSELKAWIALFGTLPRAELTAAHVRHAMGAWTAEPKAPKTINHRVQRLQHLFRILDGRHAPTPCDDVALLRVPRTVPLFITAETINRVLAALQAGEQAGTLRDGKTRARFMVLASTGKRPSELMRAEPLDVDLERRVWIVRDGKGGWSPGVYLNDDMLAAWRVFVAEQAWGPWETSSMSRVLRTAGWPRGVRPYNLRHSVGLALSESGVDLSDVQAHMGHKRIATTRQHYVPVLNSRMQKASELLDGRLGWGDAKG